MKSGIGPTSYHERAKTEDEIRRRFYCVDCGFDTFKIEYYAVTNEIWHESGMDHLGGMLCIGCLEERIARRLTPRDFPDIPVNRGSRGVCKKSNRLLDRLGRLTP